MKRKITARQIERWLELASYAYSLSETETPRDKFIAAAVAKMARKWLASKEG